VADGASLIQSGRDDPAEWSGAPVRSFGAESLPGRSRNAGRCVSRLARTLIQTRGRLDAADRSSFLEAGFEKAHLLEVIAIVAASTITNYTGNVAQPPLEEAFAGYKWEG
jgi:hypothetical protein